MRNCSPPQHLARLLILAALLALIAPCCPGAAQVRFIYVDGAYQGPEEGSPERPYSTIAAALAVAQAGDLIRVARGPQAVYAERLHITKPVTLQGGYNAANWERDLVARDTVLDGQGEGPVVTIGPWADPGAQAVLEGFTITNGSAAQGAGILVEGASPVIRHNRISGNWATGQGGGILVRDGSPTIRDNVMETNTAERGGGICLIRSDALIAGNWIMSNSGGQGGGISIEQGSRPRLENNTIIANEARDGAGMHVSSGSQAEMVNQVLFMNHATQQGGGLGVDSASARVVHASILYNLAGQGGGVAAWGDGTAVTLTNSLVWGHGGDDLAGPHITASHSNVEQELLLGPGNLSADPRLADPQRFDFHLLPDSPLVDAGVAVSSIREDFEGHDRWFDGDGDGVIAADIGADEVAADPRDLALRIVAAHSFPVPGGTLRYAISATNLGQVDAPAATLTVTLPPGLAVQGETLTASLGAWRFEGAGLVWRGPLPVGERLDLAFRAGISDALPVDTVLTSAIELAFGAQETLQRQAIAFVVAKREAALPLLLKGFSP